MKNYDYNCPIYPEGDVSEYNIAPNGQYIVYVAQPTRVSSWTDRFHVYLHPIPSSSDEEDTSSLN